MLLVCVQSQHIHKLIGSEFGIEGTYVIHFKWFMKLMTRKRKEVTTKFSV